VTRAFDLPLDVIQAQLEAIFSDIKVAAAKTGMLSSAAIVEEVASFWRTLRSPPALVVDPVMISKSGYHLLKPEAVESVRRQLLPLATVVTPNHHEAELLAERPIRDRASALEAGRRILDLGPGAVLLKGGHVPEGAGETTRATDLLIDRSGVREFTSERFDTSSTHGTGCTFSAAICAGLGRGLVLEEAISRAKVYIAGAIRHGLRLGHGHGPTHHFYFLPDPTALHGRG
jgi:hydroxymethylpyrimidine/phosphomethylpyrimidine kinase